jgi:dTDP-4-amino-4,6-dideoxygalactose transaminase
MKIMKVPFVDLKAQYAEIQEDIEKDVLDVLRSWWVVGGPQVQAFEEELGEFLGGQHVCGVSSGTDALVLALESLTSSLVTKPKKYILCPSNTFIASAFAIRRAGFEPLFVDPAPDTYLLDPTSVRNALLSSHGKDIAGVMCVHLYGQMCDMQALCDLTWAHNIWLIEDSAQAIGATQNTLISPGMYGHIGCTSFYPAKNLGTCGQGGAVFSTDKALIDHVRTIANQGGSKKYEHATLGGNYRLDSLMAAQLRHALKKLNEWDDKRVAIAARYDEAFGRRAPLVVPGNTHVYHLYEYQCDDSKHRKQLMETLASADIACGLHYPNYVSNEAPFRDSLRLIQLRPRLCDKLLTLPMFPTMTDEQVEYVIETVNAHEGV